MAIGKFDQPVPVVPAEIVISGAQMIAQFSIQKALIRLRRVDAGEIVAKGRCGRQTAQLLGDGICPGIPCGAAHQHTARAIGVAVIM